MCFFFGAPPVDLNPQFAILPHSDVPGVGQTKRFTNLEILTVDTSWWTRYRKLVDSLPQRDRSRFWWRAVRKRRPGLG
jgi:hypothetical protein